MVGDFSTSSSRSYFIFIKDYRNSGFMDLNCKNGGCLYKILADIDPEERQLRLPGAIT